MSNSSTETAGFGNGCETAFPTENGPNESTQYGLTKRELFAAMAMQGLLSHEWLAGNRNAPSIASVAVECADALLGALEKTHG